MDGHPASSKFDLFEAFVENIVSLAQSNPEPDVSDLYTDIYRVA